MAGMGPRWREWADKLAEGRYLCVSWPEEFGGRGLGGIELSLIHI